VEFSNFKNSKNVSKLLQNFKVSKGLYHIEMGYNVHEV
jgi:hypothetical protein